MMSAKERIMDAAEKIFAHTGFSGASMQAIAESAWVAKSLIYHHFDSKRDLWTKVVDRRMHDHKFIGSIQETLSILASHGIEGAGETDGYRHYFDFLRRNPRLVRMMAWLSAEQSNQSLPRHPPSQFQRAALEKIRSIQDKGIFRTDINPIMFILLLMAASEFWFTANERIIAWFGDDRKADDLEKEYIDSVASLLLDGIRGKP